MKRFFLASFGVALASACGGAAGAGTQSSQSDTLGSTQAGAGNLEPGNAGSGTESAGSGQMGSTGGSAATGDSGNAGAGQAGTGDSDTDAAGAGSGGNDAEPQGGAGGIESAGAGGMGVAGSGITLITAGAGASAGACTDSAPSQAQVDAGGGTVEATAGTFTDHCDENGDLVEYSCEVQYVQSPNCVGVTGPGRAALPAAAAPLADIAVPFCDLTEVITGNVTEVVTACGGRCEGAVCPFECPVYDELLTYVSVDRETGAAVFAFDRVGHDLSCELIFDRDTDDYSCITDPEAGREIVLPSLGINSRFCLEGNIGNIGVDDPTYDGIEECAYRCDVLLR